jgi:uncharacterized damage-inducible protein DinB
MSNPVSISLAKTLHSARQMTKFYLSKTAGLDLQKRFDINGFETNSIHWIVAHLCWAEDALILQAVGNQTVKQDWFDKFSFGSTPPGKEVYPNYEEALKTLDDVHKRSLNMINGLTEAQLQETNHLGWEFGGSKTKETIIAHSIRHEGMHSGHLGWLLRMHGVPKIF